MTLMTCIPMAPIQGGNTMGLRDLKQYKIFSLTFVQWVQV